MRPGSLRAGRARASRALFPIAAAAALALPPSGAAAAPTAWRQTAGSGAGGASPDSIDLHDRARAAQRRFELRRVRELPTTLGWSGGECDDRVGRMCWRHDTGGRWTPDPDPPATTAARDELLRTLEDVSRALPGDRWVLGQRVWYLGEAGRDEEALALARRCRTPEVWWCGALEGLVLHRVGRYAEAEAAFDGALRGMRPDAALAWVDPSVLLDGDGRDALEDARDEGRQDLFLARLWSAADPLWIVAGNDRLTEHLARRTVAELRDGARTAYGISWGDDLEELLLRYGWEVGWERVLPPPGSILETGGAVGHEHPESRSFIPPGRVLADPAGTPPDAWVPRLAYAPSAYAPAYAPVFLPAPSNVAVLPLGDSAAVVATWELPADTTFRTREGLRPGPDAEAGGAVEAGLVVRSDGGEEVAAARAVGETGAMMVSVPAGRWVASVEVLDRDARLAGRHRRGLDAPAAPPDVATLSDLLVAADGPEPGTVEELLPRLLTGSSLPPDRTIRVAWVVAGLGLREESLSYRLSVLDPERGFLRRAGEWLGLVDREAPQRLVWEEPAPSTFGPGLRSVRMTLPELDPGTYVLRLELATRGRTTVVSERTFEVLPGPAGG